MATSWRSTQVRQKRHRMVRWKTPGGSCRSSLYRCTIGRTAQGPLTRTWPPSLRRSSPQTCSSTRDACRQCSRCWSRLGCRLSLRGGGKPWDLARSSRSTAPQCPFLSFSAATPRRTRLRLRRQATSRRVAWRLWQRLTRQQCPTLEWAQVMASLAEKAMGAMAMEAAATAAMEIGAVKKAMALMYRRLHQARKDTPKHCRPILESLQLGMHCGR
mmetsp:Transcript_18669/g.42858  ORF Transcript_18669/g.42858 Transcript_18669/m.42858 type:complete len:215 (+) Transcript_18669:1052-1696(+)